MVFLNINLSKYTKNYPKSRHNFTTVIQEKNHV